MKFIILPKILLLCLMVNAVFSNDEQPKTCKKFVCSEDLLNGECLKVSEEDDVILLKKCDNNNEFCNLMKRDKKEFRNLIGKRN